MFRPPGHGSHVLELRDPGTERSLGRQEWYPGWHMNGSYEHKHEDIDVKHGKYLG